MNAPKRHHFIPQMMLRHFADADGQLWFWRRDFGEGDVRKTTTQNLFVEKDLYTLVHPDGARDVALEKFFAELEGVGAKFINRLTDIVRRGGAPALDNSAWDFWNHFFYYHLKRTPGAIAVFAAQMGFEDKIKGTVEKIRAIRRESGRDPNEPGLEEQLARNAVIVAQAAKPSTEVLAAFDQLGLAIYRIVDPSRSFIVGDVPGAMARFRLPEGGMSRETLFLPLTWDIAVGQLASSRRVEVVTIDRDQVRRMNEASTARSMMIAGRSEALIESLAHRVVYTGSVEGLMKRT